MSRRRTLSTLAVVLIVTGCSGIKSQTNSYATLAEAQQAGAIKNQWMPEGLPPGSHDIREAHVPGTPQRWGLFDYPHPEEDVLRGLLQPEEIAVDRQRCDVPSRIEWWPLLLRGQLDGSRIAATGLRVYSSKDGSLIFAVNWSQGRAYYWSPGN